MCYFIDIIRLKRFLKNIKSVGAAYYTEVTLYTAVPDSPNADADKDKATVSKLANNQLKKRMS
jgi:hypothetical protein